MNRPDNPNPVGQPPKFKSVADMQAAIDKFFADCDEKGDPYTMSGLAYSLDMGRQTLINYENKDEYLDTVKQARRRVEMYVEKLMLKSNGVVAGVIFNAKNNFGWRDKTETEQTIVADVTSNGETVKATDLDALMGVLKDNTAAKADDEAS